MSTSSTPQVTVFSQPGCPTCAQVKSFLKARGVAYVDRDVSTDEAAMNELEERGYSATPVTVIGDVEILGMNRVRFEKALPAPAEATHD